MRFPPGPRGRETLGFFPHGEHTTLNFLEETARKYGPISSFRVAHKRVYLVDDADLVKDILVNQQHSFQRDTGATLLKELLGDSLITREEPKHKERRRILQPAFHREQIEHYGKVMCDEIAAYVSEWRDGGVLDIRNEMRRMTLAVAGSALFGTDFRSSADKVAEVLQKVTTKSVRILPVLALVEPAFTTYRKWFPKGPSVLFQKERAALKEIIAPVLAERRSRGTKDILSLILNARNEEDAPLTDEEVGNEIVTFMLAGHETTATALTFTCHLLGQTPDVAQRMYSELENVLGARSVCLEDLPQLPYTSAVLQEGMRLYPPVLAFARRAMQPVKLAGYEIPRGASVFVSPYITQRNTRYFENPEVFHPARWLANAPTKFAYFPFGGGAKSCIGEPFARLEAVLALAEIGRKWRISCCNEDKIKIGLGMLLRPNRTMRLKVDARKGQGGKIVPSEATAQVGGTL